MKIHPKQVGSYKLKAIQTATAAPLLECASLHFHPEPGKEMYYIEIQTKDTEIIKNVTEQIKLYYTKIQNITSQFPVFQSKLDSVQSLKNSDKYPLVDWLIKKGLVWEGSIYAEKGKEKVIFGDIAANSHYLDWFDSLKTETDSFILQ